MQPSSAKQAPELLGAVAGERMLDRKRAAQPDHVLGRVVHAWIPAHLGSVRPLELEGCRSPRSVADGVPLPLVALIEVLLWDPEIVILGS